MREKTALVTGAASGIGAAVARRLAGEGVGALVLTDRDGPGLKALAAELKGPRVMTHAADVADEAAWARLEGEVRRAFGGLDLVVANAGISDASPIAETDFAAWRRLMSVNLDGVFLTLRSGMRLARDGAAMVVVSSASAVKAEPGVGAYGASKAAVLQLAKVAAKEGAPRRIRVNAVLPGGVETPIWRPMAFFQELVATEGGEQAAFDKMAGFATPLGRYAKAGEVADMICWLLSDRAGFVTGAALVADGGYTL